MRIAFILPSLANKGPIVFTKYLIEGLKDKVKYIKVFYFDEICELDVGVPIQKISFLEKIDFTNYDIVHTTMAKPDLFGWLNKGRLKNKWVSSAHNYYKEDLALSYGFFKARIYSFIWKIGLFSLENMIVSSQEMLNYYATDLGSKNFGIIPYGISRKNSLGLLSKSENDILCNLKEKYTIIGSVGLLIRRKGFHQLIDILKSNENYAVVIIGDGIERNNLESLAKINNVEDRVLLLGFKHNSIDYYKYFDIYAMTSYSEGFGLAMLEAMSQSLPVVCSHLEIYNDYFTKDDVCFFEIDNLESLKSAILDVTNKYEHYKEASYHLYKSKFSLEAMTNRHIGYYEKIINDQS